MASAKLELRGNYRDSNEERFALSTPLPPILLPPGETQAFLETVDAGTHWEASDVTLRLDLTYGKSFAARAKIDAIDLYNRNPTSSDDKFDVDEVWIRFGRSPRRGSSRRDRASTPSSGRPRRSRSRW